MDMSEDQAVIERLTIPTQTRLRSTQILTSLPQIISELLQNSLDAGATQISIGLDCKEWMCWVQDNGHGIRKDDLEAMQGEDGGRYRTSKVYAGGQDEVSTFGFRGEALASAADLSCLEISSRTAKSQNTWAVILKGQRQLYFGTAVRWKRETQGTTICIRDAFYNFPVRRRSHPTSLKSWEMVRQEIEAHALVFPHVSFNLEDVSRNSADSSQSERTFRVPNSNSTLSTFKRLFGGVYTDNIHPVDMADGGVKIQGFISLVGSAAKSYQFLYINQHRMATCDLHRLIDLEFASSAFSKNALDESPEINPPRQTVRRSPRKLDKKPVYLLDILIPPQDVDNHLDPGKRMVLIRNNNTVRCLLISILKTFLSQNGFLQRTDTTPSPSVTPFATPRKRRKNESNVANDSGFVEFFPTESVPNLVASTSLYIEDPPSNPLYALPEGDSNEVMIWTDPITHLKFRVDSRTGHSYEVHQRRTENERVENQRRRYTLRHPIASSLADPDPLSGRSAAPAWLEQALHCNEAYVLPENAVPCVQFMSDSVERVDEILTYGKTAQQQYLRPDRQHMAHQPKGGLSIHNFSKDDLRQAEIIDQVDQKFIACKIVPRYLPKPPETQTLPVKSAQSATLVLIDQHAADERVRVECFLKELCLGFLYSIDPSSQKEARAKPLSIIELLPPWPVLLTRHEALTINRSPDIRELLRKWGIRIVESSKASEPTSEFGCDSEYSQLLVSSIPEIVSEKLLQGDELRDLIKGFLGQIQSGELHPDYDLDLVEEANHLGWLKALRHCPRGLLELINSKACRGAIMFNDPLTRSQCVKLVQQLSETAFPFQCAHGRPSLVPLIETTISGTNDVRKPSRDDWDRLEGMTG